MALLAKTGDLAVLVDLVVLKDGELDLLWLSLVLLWGGVDLLLSLLGSSEKLKVDVDGGLRVDSAIAILELTSGVAESLLFGWNSLGGLDFFA